MPPILERWKPDDAAWRDVEDCAVAHVSGWRVRTLDHEWTARLRAPVVRTGGGRRSARRRTPIQLEVEFENMADEWEKATDFESVVMRKVMHPAYQRIIGMGSDVVPLILRRLQREPRQWFWALTSITGEDPAEDQTTAEGAARAWLDWGRRQGMTLA